MKVILDGVFNHSGADSLYFNKFGTYDSLGAYQSKSSPYYDWYYFKKFPDEYACWWGCDNVPDLNKSNKDYRALVFGKTASSKSGRNSARTGGGWTSWTNCRLIS